MRIVLVISFVALAAGCLPYNEPVWREIPTDQASLPTGSKERLRPGEDAYIRTRDGKRYRFRVTRVDERAFYGVASDDASYRVPFKIVESIEVERMGWEWRLVPARLGPITSMPVR